MDYNLVIKPMAEEHLVAVAAIEKNSFQEPWSLDSFQAEIETNRLAIYLVACLEKKVIGYIGAWIIINEVHITTLAVHSERRRQGVASRLIGALMEITGPRGASCLTLEVRPSNSSAISFYEKCGFQVLGCRKHYYVDEDALIMTKTNLTLPERVNKGEHHEE